MEPAAKSSRPDDPELDREHQPGTDGRRLYLHLVRWRERGLGILLSQRAHREHFPTGFVGDNDTGHNGTNVSPDGEG